MTLIYHITNLKNLPGVIAAGCLRCDAQVSAKMLGVVGIAHQHIKERRARKVVKVGPGGVVADYVPFYFAPRSPMLFTISGGNVAGYEEGQTKVVYLVSSVKRVISDGLPYCFTDGHAEMGPTLFFDDWKTHKDKVPWDVMPLTYWNDTTEQPDRKRRRQAEFLVHGAFPWGAVEGIGVYNFATMEEVKKLIKGLSTPPITVRRSWYY